MASIREKIKDGKIVSYQFIACLGRDEQGKQIRQYTTWTLPKGVGQKTARKEAEKQAALWEESLKQQEAEEAPVPVKTPTEHRDDFITFIEKTWFPLKVEGNDRKDKTIAFYSSILKIIESYFSGMALQDITAIDIETYLSYLRTEYSLSFLPGVTHHCKPYSNPSKIGLIRLTVYDAFGKMKTSIQFLCRRSNELKEEHKMKKFLAMLMVLILLATLGGVQAFADGEDVIEPVHVEAGDPPVDMNSVTVDHAVEPAVYAEASAVGQASITVDNGVTSENAEATAVVAIATVEGGTATVDVGSVSVDGGPPAVVATAENGGETSVTIETTVTDTNSAAPSVIVNAYEGTVTVSTGDVSVTESSSEENTVWGVYAQVGNAATGTTGDADVKMGDVTVSESDGKATDVIVHAETAGSTATVEIGDLTASGGQMASGLSTEVNPDAAIDVTTGDVSTAATAAGGNSTGVRVFTDGGNASIETGDITSDGGQFAMGVSTTVYEGGNSSVTTGDVIAASTEGSSQGIRVITDTGIATVKAGDVNSTSAGQYAQGVDVYSEGGTALVETGNVTANITEGNANALYVSTEGGTATVTTGDVIGAATDGSVRGVSAKVYGGSSTITTGDVTASVRDGKRDSTVDSIGISIEAPIGTSTVTTGDVTVTSGGDGFNSSYGVFMKGSADATVNNVTVTAEGGDYAEARGINISGVGDIPMIDLTVIDDTDGKATVTAGDVTATAQGNLYSFAQGISVGGIGAITVSAGNVTATADQNAAGVLVYPLETAMLSLSGDVSAATTDENSSAYGIDIEYPFYDDGGKPHETTVQITVGGDVSGTTAGISINEPSYDDNTKMVADLIVSGTLEAGTDGAVVVSPYVNDDNLDLTLTVWQIEWDKEDHAIYQQSWDDQGNMTIESNEYTQSLEEKINYIIKIEAGQEDIFAGTQETGLANETVAVKLAVPVGYTLKGAFTDEGKTAALLQDDEGNYYVLVPKSGGIYLSASLSAIPSSSEGSSSSSDDSAPEYVASIQQNQPQKQIPTRIVTGTVNGNTVTEEQSKVIVPLDGATLTALRNGNDAFAKALDTATMNDTGIVDFKGAFDDAEEEEIYITSIGSYKPGCMYTIVFSNGKVLYVLCTKYGELTIPFPKDASGLGYVVYFGSIK